MKIHWRAIHIDADSLAHECLSAPCGRLCIATQGNVITDIAWSLDHSLPVSAHDSPLQQKFLDYFTNPNTPLDWDLAVQGSEFQRRAWQALAQIPAGQVVTYGQLAKRLASSPRAVAQACRRNPYPVIIPCHRVIGGQGIGGYCGSASGPFLEIKRWLLQHERWVA